MRIHILGICGTFMGGLAMLAKQLGHEVSGSDANVYPPMSETLQASGILIQEGYDPKHLQPAPDLVIIGNTISRGNPALEYLLNQKIRYVSGPAWLSENVLQSRHVLAISGTHGKTTASSLLAWILSCANLQPGHLIGGVPNNFTSTAELGGGDFFVIEADEYDTAFFDKRSKFIHYHPRTLVINNLEYDHADIFPDLESIKRQFEILIRTVPGCGTIIYPEQETEIKDVLSRGCWSSKKTIGSSTAIWQAKNVNEDGSQFELWHRDQKLGVVNWSLLGKHNIQNALSAIAAAHEVGVTAEIAIAACKSFQGVKRRMEVRGKVNDITIYDDFAHHPTAIATTLAGLRSKVKNQRIIAVIEFASNTMRMGYHRDTIANALSAADEIIFLNPNNTSWDPKQLISELGSKAKIFNDVTAIIHHLQQALKPNDHVLIMSNRGFDGIHSRLLDRLQVNSLRKEKTQ